MSENGNHLQETMREYDRLRCDGNFRAALNLILAKAKRDPANYRLYQYAGAMCLELEDYKGAIQYLERAFDVDENPALLNNLAIAYFRIGEVEKAIDFLERATLHFPTFITSYVHLAEIHKELNGLAYASECLNEAEAHASRADFDAAGEIRRARESLEDARNECGQKNGFTPGYP